MPAYKYMIRETTRESFVDAQRCGEFLRSEGYVVKSYLIDNEAERYYRIIYMRDEEVTL